MSSICYDNLPLSRAQMGVWRDIKLKPHDISYCIWDYISLSGNINRCWLQQAIAHVCESSPNFWLKFTGDPLDALQRELRSIRVHVPYVDLSGREDPEQAAFDWMVQDHHMSFDVEVPPLCRNAVLQISADRLYWYRNYHHLVVDGYSTMLLGAWTAEAYRVLARSSGDSEALSARIFPSYKKYLAYEAEYRRSAQYQADRLFWTSRYRGLPEPVSLSVHRYPPAGSGNTVVTSAWLSADVSAALNRWSEKLFISVSHLLIAAIAIYVYRATGETVIPICLPTHGRESMSTIGMAGMCANVLQLCLEVDELSTVARNITSISACITEALKHRQYRREDLRAELGSDEGAPSPFRIHANVVPSIGRWTFNDQPARGNSGCGGPVEDLMFLLVESKAERRYRVSLLGNPLLYDEWEVTCHHQHFCHLLSTIADASDIPVYKTAIAADAGRYGEPDDRVTSRLKQPSASRCFHQLFESQAAKTPAAIAVAEGHRGLSYKELDQRSNRLAHYLCNSGVRRGDIVGLCIDRSIDMVVSVLGILKAGGAYLPLDVEMPPARLAFIVGDAKARLIMTQTAHELLLPDHLAQLMFIDAIESEMNGLSCTPPPSHVEPTDLAYVIYTSGSTGKPKGVLVEHAGVYNLLVAQREFVSATVGTRVLQFARLSFDVSVSEIGMALTSGATLVMAGKVALALENLGATLRAEDIDVLSITPSGLSVIKRENLPRLKTVIVAGEACPISLARRWSANCRFINAYGPTEATVYATYHEYCGSDLLSIGRPIANVETYILDDRLRPVPAGIVGELYIGGAGVARGYLNRENLSSALFVANPFREPPQRMYRTGDLSRQLPDGNIEFLGRRDRQVKIRGFRVELGEVEAAIEAVGHVKECAVCDYQKGSRRQLLAYVVHRESTLR